MRYLYLVKVYYKNTLGKWRLYHLTSYFSKKALIRTLKYYNNANYLEFKCVVDYYKLTKLSKQRLDKRLGL